MKSNSCGPAQGFSVGRFFVLAPIKDESKTLSSASDAVHQMSSVVM
jgi:hypothetical protein